CPKRQASDAPLTRFQLRALDQPDLTLALTQGARRPHHLRRAGAAPRDRADLLDEILIFGRQCNPHGISAWSQVRAVAPHCAAPQTCSARARLLLFACTVVCSCRSGNTDSNAPGSWVDLPRGDQKRQG